LTRAAVLLGFALVAFLIENAFPPPFAFAPFLKLGISNAFVLLALIVLGGLPALLILIAKSFITALYTGLFSMYFSLPSGLVSLAVMALVYRRLFPAVGVVAVSVAGSAVFNAVQLAAYALISGTAAPLAAIPPAVLLSTLTGAVTGFAVYYSVRALPEKLLLSD